MHKTIPAYSESEIGVNAQKIGTCNSVPQQRSDETHQHLVFEEEKAEDICISEATGERWSIY